MNKVGLPRGYVGTPRTKRRSKAKGLALIAFCSKDPMRFEVYPRQMKRVKEDNKHFKKCGVPEIPVVGAQFNKVGRIYLN